jgi:hypothetical protein
MEPILIVFALLTVAVVVWLVMRSRPEPPGAFIDFSKPPWSEAKAKAQQTVPVLRELFATHGSAIMVKYPLKTTRGENEHVWGALLELGETTLSATLDTPLRQGKPLESPPFSVALSELEDWQLELPNGAIRGGFTIRLDIQLAREQGRAVPDHVAAMEHRLVDA